MHYPASSRRVACVPHKVGCSSHGRGAKGVFGDILPELQAADVNVFNLEVVLTDQVEDPKSCCKFRAPINVSLAALRAANLNVALVANNHQKDFGSDPLKESLASLDAAGI
eukprot:6798988-Prymnesium_polylepis.4